MVCNKRRSLIVVIILLFIILLTGCSEKNDVSKDQSASGYILTGRITKKEDDNKGIENVNVLLDGSKITPYRVETYSDGRWFATGLKGEVEVKPIKGGWCFEPTKRVINKETENVDFSGIEFNALSGWEQAINEKNLNEAKKYLVSDEQYIESWQWEEAYQFPSKTHTRYLKDDILLDQKRKYLSGWYEKMKEYNLYDLEFPKDLSSSPIEVTGKFSAKVPDMEENYVSLKYTGDIKIKIILKDKWYIKEINYSNVNQLIKKDITMPELTREIIENKIKDFITAVQQQDSEEIKRLTTINNSRGFKVTDFEYNEKVYSSVTSLVSYFGNNWDLNNISCESYPYIRGELHDKTWSIWIVMWGRMVVPYTGSAADIENGKIEFHIKSNSDNTDWVIFKVIIN